MKQQLTKWSAWLLIMSLVVSLFATGAGQASADNSSAATPAGYVTLSVEKFTLGQGYYREPVKVPFYADDNGASVLTRALGTDNIGYTGSIDSAFYLLKVKDDASEIHIPQYILDQIEIAHDQIGGKQEPDWLGASDYTSQSGWMSEVNDEFPPYGFSDYTPQDGDVIRTQFSVYGYGADLDTAWGYGFIDSADKDELTAAIAEFNGRADKAVLLEKPGIKAAYDHAYEVLANIESEQASVDAALAEWNAELAKDRTKPVMTIQGLTDNQESASAQLAFKVGVTDNVDTDIAAEVRLNGTVVAATAAGGQYSVQLNVGSNTIIVSATDAAGNRAEQSFTVLYRSAADRANAQLNKSLAYILATVSNPKFGTGGGEWSVLSLARANYPVPTGYYDIYYNNVKAQVASLMEKNSGVLDKSKSTEHSRLLIGLSAIGKDARDVAGYDITQALADYDYVLKQGNNGPFFALIGMDTYGYAFPEAEEGKTQATRASLIGYILDKEVKKGTAEAGGWALGVTKADVDMTAMAIQALAPYYEKNADVKAAVDRAVTWLSQAQNATGSYTVFGSTSSESLSQVVTALSEIGIDAAADPRFVKNGISAIDALLAFGVADGGFKHVLTGKVDNMATDQGAYALVAYNRMKQGAPRLYDMKDVMPQQARELNVKVPSGDEPHIVIPQDDAHDFLIPITDKDADKSITVDIPEDAYSRVSFGLPSDAALPQIEAVKGAVSALIPQGARVVSGDASKLQWLTSLDAASDALQSQIAGIVAQGAKLDSVEKAVTMGGSASVAFDQFVTLTFQGLSGKQAAYIQNGTAHAIAKYATDAEGAASGASEYAYDSGSDLIVKTKHFTDFAAYAASVVSTPGGTGPGTDGGTQPKLYVTLAVDKLTIGQGYVVSAEQVELQSGDTAWSVLERRLKAKGIPFEYTWSGQYGSVYVQSIDGDGEFDHGTGSGWMYNVNGIYPNYGASQYALKGGDSIQWRYTTNLGGDLGAGQDGGNTPVNPGTPGTGGGATIDPNDKAPVVNVPKDIQSDYGIRITQQQRSADSITVNLPDVDLKAKVLLQVEDVKDGIPSIVVKKGGVTLAIDKDTKLKSGSGAIELFSALNTNDEKLKALVQGSLSGQEQLKSIDLGFVMGASTGSFLFDTMLTLTIKGGKGKLAGYVENNRFVPIPIYSSEQEGAQATAGSEKASYAYVVGDDLVIKTNHFTSYVTYSTQPAGSVGAIDLSATYADADAISAWAYDAVGRATQLGLLQGSGGKLNPKSTITRAEFTKLLVTALGLDTTSGKPSGFQDVAKGQWFYPYVAAANEAGFITGYGGKFNPGDTITREQMAVMIVRAFGLQTAKTAGSPLQDSDQVSQWAAQDVKTVVSLGLMVGQNDRFKPADAVTREMATVVAIRAIDQRGGSAPGASGGGTPEDGKQSVRNLIAATAAYQQRTIADPVVASIGGEWTVLGLARSGAQVPASYYAKYNANLAETLKEKSGKLHAIKYTEYDRVILALTSLGQDVTDVAGYNLLKPLADFDTLIKQGINGPIFALIALDSSHYEIPAAADVKTQTTRELLVRFILAREISGGGWALGEQATEPDPDVTAMAIQGLAPYYKSDNKVRAAVDRAIEWLSKTQRADGGYSSMNSVNSESVSQVIVALTSLGIDPHTDARFVKNGHSAVDALLGFAASGGGFYHIKQGGVDNGGAKPGEVDPMATDQAMYALVAYNRYVNGQTSLYDMTDVQAALPAAA